MASGINTTWIFPLDGEQTKVEVHGRKCIKVNDIEVPFTPNVAERTLEFIYKGHYFKVTNGATVYLGLNIQLYLDNHNIVDGTPYIQFSKSGAIVVFVLFLVLGILFGLFIVGPILIYMLVIFLIFRKRTINIKHLPTPVSFSGNYTSETTPILHQVVVVPPQTTQQPQQPMPTGQAPYYQPNNVAYQPYQPPQQQQPPPPQYYQPYQQQPEQQLKNID
ncbi:hypothetical protein PPL_00405 [Heterostelium album PN500]|uniref:Uncharacterized protein n=1 Tax=Heterostelium pallidum (strain ATCC 26659 / Pp 5 / PN500) TaxID=670386 RepID=D3AWD1_HETP5|nr:hypothetical protein PPL_00405 [Heterostelium album PN500]EFA86604.1 hypothetical protein PPL_00405 [Heterostelium album PN500]|eukprot:XP_020438709.1 hypothetical protein PPL_00405 [Heterostelium album PN500]